MITPSELRIGNIILFNGEPVKVMGIQSGTVMLEGVMYETGNPNFPYEYRQIPADDASLEPIPLIDDILQKIRTRIPMNGKRAYKYYGTKATFLIFEDEDGGGYYIGMTYMDQVFRVTPQPLYYFHQLQNIYFAQYGDEFDFNERLLSLSVKNAVDDGLT